jgi:CheY-like chemotaxis protein
MTAVSKTFPDNQPSSTPVDLSGLHVLVVDDEADMRDLAVVILSEYGANVRVATSAAEALLVLDSFQPDVLVSDIGMPEVDGYTLMRQVRTRPPHQNGQIPAIALTAYVGELNREQTLAAGFQMHVAKPVEPEVLARAIANLVTGI